MATLAGLLIALSSFIYAARADCRERCQERVNKREAHEKWRAVVRAYGVARLRARMRCEAGNHGGYRHITNGLFWFGHQFEARAWAGAGGRFRKGRPVGVWTMQPEPLEQDYRAVRWDRVHSGDPWPNCP